MKILASRSFHSLVASLVVLFTVGVFAAQAEKEASATRASTGSTDPARPAQHHAESMSAAVAKSSSTKLNANSRVAAMMPLSGQVSVSAPAAPGSLSPHLVAGADGTLVMSWLEPAGSDHALRYSQWNDSGWSAPRAVAAGDNWFVNWADFPSVTPITTRFWIGHWLQRRPAGGYAYDIYVSVSQDGGTTWGDGFRLHDDDTDTEHGFVSVYPANDSAGLVWLDGRNTGSKSGGMTLRNAIVHADGTISDEQEIDNLICDCCQTDALLSNDKILVAYRDRTHDEIRDVSTSRRTDNGWTTGSTVANDDWKIGGCPVNGPALAGSANTVAVAWFTAADDKPRVRLSRSVDNGATYNAPVDVIAGNTLGRVGVVVLSDGSAIVSAIEGKASGNARLTLTRVDSAGKPDTPFVVAEDVQPFSVPQLTHHEGALVLAWTVRGQERTQIRSAIIPLAASNVGPAGQASHSTASNEAVTTR